MTANNFQASEHPLRRDDEMPSLLVSDTNPLAFWRMLPSHAFDHASVGKLRTALLSTSLLREPRWSDAVRGDPIAVVGIAATLLPAKSVTPFIDIVMSALCLNALRGNGGCTLVLSHVLNALGRQNPECWSAWGPDAYRRVKLLIYQAMEGQAWTLIYTQIAQAMFGCLYLAISC
jgi:hypothetical protein